MDRLINLFSSRTVSDRSNFCLHHGNPHLLLIRSHGKHLSSLSFPVIFAVSFLLQLSGL